MKMNLLSLYQSLLLIYSFFVGCCTIETFSGFWRSVYRFVCVGQTLTRSDLKQFTNGNHLKAGSSSGVLVCDIEFTIWISHSWIFKHEIKTIRVDTRSACDVYVIIPLWIYAHEVQILLEQFCKVEFHSIWFHSRFSSIWTWFEILLTTFSFDSNSLSLCIAIFGLWVSVCVFLTFVKLNDNNRFVRFEAHWWKW